MLKNKIVVRKIRNIVILLMAILIMIGAYKNIDRSRAENVIEISAIALDNYSCLDNEEFTLEAKEISDGLYEIEIPETINTKQVNQVIEVTIESKTQGGNAETIEITDNKIYLTTEQIENNEIKFKTIYDVAITVIDEQGKYSKELLSEMAEEEITEVKTMTEGNGLLYNRTLKYEENGKTIEVKGYMLDDVELEIGEVTQEQLSETYGEIQINSAYDIKTIREIESQEEQGTTEIIEINPLEYGETFEVSITDSKIQKNSDVYYLKDENTCNQVEVNENIAGNIKFNMYYSGVYAVKQQQLSLFAESTINDNLANLEVNTQTTGNETQMTESGEITANTKYFVPARATWIHDVNSYGIYVNVFSPSGLDSFNYIAWTNTTTTPTNWNESNFVANKWNECSAPLEAGTWYLHVKSSNGDTYYAGPYRLQQADSSGSAVYATTPESNVVNGDFYVDVSTDSGTLSGSSVLAYWSKYESEVGTDDQEHKRTVTSTSDTTHRYNMGLPAIELDEDGDSVTEGIYYIAYKYWGMNSNGASVIGYSRSPKGYKIDRKGPVLEYVMDNETFMLLQEGWKNSDVAFTVTLDGGYIGITTIETSEDRENWEIVYDVGTEIPQIGYGINQEFTEERPLSNIYYRGTDEIGQVGKIYSIQIGIDKTNPTVTINKSSDTNYTKTKDIIITANDALSGLGEGTEYQYCLLEEGTTPSSSTVWTTYANGESTTIGEGLTGKYYLFVKPVTDQAGNKSSTSYHEFGPYYFDNTAPTITLGSNSNTTYAKTHNVTVTLEDAHSGLAAGTSQAVKYGWSLSNTEEPSSYTTVTLPNSEGASSATFTAQGNGITGEYYLWVVPYSTNYVKDKLENTNTTPVKSTGKFFFDNEAPTITLGANSNTNWSKEHSVTVTLADGHAGLAADSNQNIQYGWSTSTTEEPSDYIIATLSNSEGAISTTFQATTPSGLATDKYYLWVVPTTYKDKLGNQNSTPVKSTGTFWIDNTAPTITLSDQKNETWAKTHSVTVTLTDAHAGLAANSNQNIQYGWSTSTTEEPSDYIPATLSNSEGAQSTTFTATTPSGLATGEYYLWVVPTTYKDKLGNQNSTTVKSTGTFWIDNTAPTITLSDQKNETWAKTHSVTVTLTDEHAGLAAGSNQNIKYGWSLSNTEEPSTSSYTPVTLSNSEGATSTTFTAEGSGLTGEYYLWVVPTIYKDKLGNQNSTPVKSIGKFYFDNQAPTAPILSSIHPSDNEIYNSGDWTNYLVGTTVSSTDAHSGIASIQYSKDKTNWITIDGELTQSGIQKSGIIDWDLVERDDSYYFKIMDNVGNEYVSSSPAFNIRYDLTNPIWTYVDKEIYYSTLNDVGNEDYANRERTVKIIFEGTDEGGRDVSSTLTAENITILVNGAPIQDQDLSVKTLDTVNNGSGKVTCTLTLKGILGDGDLTISIPGETLTDKAGNKNGGQSLSTQIDIDNTNPNIVLDVTTPAGTYKANEKIIITATYNENIYKEITSNTLITTPADAPEMTLVFVDEEGNEIPTKGNVSCIDVDENKLTYEYTIQAADNSEGTNGDNGTLKIKSLGAVYDAAGNAISGSEKTSNIIADTIHPTIISITPDKTSPTNAENITYTVEFSETVTGFVTEDIIVNSGKETEISVSGSGTTYYVTITTTDDDEYTESITIAEGACTDIAGNPNIGATSSEILVDRIDPTLTITADKESPTNAEKIIYTLTFTENVTLSEVQNIIANSGEESIAVSGSGTIYIVTVPTTDNQTYTEKITVNVGAFTDKAGNGNIEATSSEILIDRIDPTITIEPISSTWTKSEISVEVTHNDDIGGSGIRSTSGQYFLTTDESPTSTGTLSSYTSGTSFNLDPGVSGEYYLYIKEISDNAGNESNEDEYVEIDGVTYHKYGKYQFDYEKPIIEKVSSSKDSSNKTETIIFKVTDSLSGIANNLDVNNIIVKIDGESTQIDTNSDGTPDTETITKILETTSKKVKNTVDGTVTTKSGDYTLGENESVVEYNYTLELSNFEQSTKIDEKIYKEWSGNVSIEIPANAIQDNAGNTSDKTDIEGDFVDFIKPAVEKVSADNNVDGTNTQTIIFNVIDKYLDTSDLITLDEDKDGDGNADSELIVKIDGQEADITKTLSIVSKFVMNKGTKAVSSQANDYVVQSTEQVIGQQYKLVLSDFDKTRPSGKYYKEWSGDVSIEIGANTVKDTSENKNDETTVEGIFADFIKPEFTYEYSETTIGDGNHTGDKTLTVVFYAADKHFDLANSSLQLSDLTVTVGGQEIVVDNSTETDVNKKNTLTAENLADGTGIKYTLVIKNLEQDPNDGYSYSGSVSITIPEGKIKDTNTPTPNSNGVKTITIGIDDPSTGDGHDSAVIVDVVDPIWKVVNSTTGTNAQGRTTVEIELIATDKYFSSVKNTREELDGLIEIQVAGIDISDEAEELTKTLSEPTYINWNSENETYTTVEEAQANGVKYTLTIENLEETYEAFLSARANNERVYREYSGPVKIVIPAGTVEDDYGNVSKIFEHDLNHIDTLRPEVVGVSSSVDTTAKTQTIIFDITDKYLNTSLINPTGLYGEISAEDNADISKINTSYIDVYVDEELTKIDTDLDGIPDTETITKTIKNIERLTATIGTNTDQLVGYRYTLELSGFEQSTINSKNYKDWSGTVSIKIKANTATDTNTPTANGNAEKTIVGKYVDFINPHIQYTHQESDIDRDGKKYIMTFNVTDKYYDGTTSQPFTVQDIRDGNIEILIQNGQKDSNGNAIIYNLKDVLTESSITLESAEISVTDLKVTNKTSGQVETVSSHLIGHTYTLTISDLEEAFITGNNTTANYSGIITVALPSDRILDRQGNKNDGKTITSIVHLPEGGTTNVVDVVRPVFDRVSSSANAVNGTATITFKGTDSYFVENSTLSADDIQVYINGVASNITKTISDPVYLKEDRLQFGTNTTIQDVQYGVKYTLTLSGFAQNVNQVKIRIPAGKLTDQYGNSNVETDLIVYNTLKVEDMLEIDSYEKTVGQIESEMDAILTDEFLGESSGTRIYPTNSNPDLIKRQEIEKIEFVNNLNSLLDGEIPKIWDTTEKEWNIKLGIQRVWDVSAQGDKSILAWTTQTGAPYTVYVGSAYEIFGNQNSKYLFAGIGSGASATATTTVVNLNALNTSSVTNMYAMFYKCGYKSMTSLDLGNFDTSNVTNMFGMFSNLGYTAMTTFDIGENFDTSKVTNMEMMFSRCGYKAITSLDLGDKFNTSNVRNMFAMFQFCGTMSMATLNLGDKFDTSNVTYMDGMFTSCGGSFMTNVYFGTESGTEGVIIFPDNFNTSNVTSMGSMFYGFGLMKMKSLDLGNNFDTSNVTDMSSMFDGCGLFEMTKLNLGDKFNTSKVEDMSDMFRDCGNFKMTSLDLGDKFYTTSATDMSNMFNSCGANVMTVLDLGPHFTNIPDGTVTRINSDGTSSTYGAHQNFMTMCGKAGELTIYAPESIYSNKTAFKLNSTSTETISLDVIDDTTDPDTYRGAINPIYKPEWSIDKDENEINKVYVDVDEENLENSTISIELKGSANHSETISGTDVKINYSSNVTSSLTAEDITVYINGVMDGDINENGVIDEGETPTITKTLTQANPQTAAEVTQTLTLSGFEETTRRTGLPFKELSGNIKIKIGGRGQATGTYGANKLVDQYGNQNMMETDEVDGTWIDVTLSDEEKEKITALDESVTEITSTTPVYMFTDFIKPEFTYTYSESDINHTNESVTVVFDVTDKYFASTTLSNLDASQITVRVADYDITTLNNEISKQLTKTATLVMNKTTKAVTAQSADYTITDANAEQKVGERYQLVVTELDQEDANGLGNAFDFSGHMSLAFNSGVITDKSGNISDATTITIGLNENDGEPNDNTIHGAGVIVDVVDPIWQLGNISLDEGTVELKAIDKYFGSVTIDEDDILVYVNGKLDGDTNQNGVIDEGETPNVTKDITSTTPIDIENGKQYTLKLSNITTGGADVTFTPSNLESDGLNNTAGFKYGDENGGTISIKILSGTITDQNGNTNVDQSFDIGVIDATKPRVYPVQKIQDVSAGTETMIFNVTDRNYDSTDLITLDVDKNDDGVVDPEITIWLDGNQIDGEVIKQLTYKPIYLNETTIVGHQYTLVLSEIIETDEQYTLSGREYRELSGTIEIRIEQDAVKDVKGNILNEDVIISDYIDYIKPELKELTVANPINTTDKTYTTSFEIRDKYLDDTTDDTQKVQEDEIKVYVDGELATAIAKPETAEAQESNKDKIWMELESTPITATFKKTVNGTITNGNYTVGHTYTLVLSNFEQSVKQSGKNFIEWSGIVKIVIDQDAVNDKNGETGEVIYTLDSDETKRTVGGYHVDFVKPVVEKVDSIRGTNTETIVFDVLDKYLDTSDVIADNEITVYVDEETATLTKALTKTAKFIMNKETKEVISQTTDYQVQSTEQVVGERYQLVLSGFEQSSRNTKNYKDWSGTVSIEIVPNAVKDIQVTNPNGQIAGGNLNNETTVDGDFVDFINPDIKYTHQSTDISKGTKSYTMTFDIIDKYYTTGQLDLDDITIKMQNGQVDSNGNAIVYDLETLANQGKVNIAFNAVPYYAEPNIKVTNSDTGEVETITTVDTHQIGHTYTLTISNLEKFEIETGLTTANYSGIVTVAIDGNVIQDRGPSGDGTNPNGNAGKTITSGVSIPGGTITDNAQVVDVVKPRIDKVSSSANAVNKTAEITFKGTDTYFVENSTISVEDMKVYINGIETTSGITKTITATTKLEEQRIGNYVQKIEDDELEKQTVNVQYGVQYTLEIKDFAQQNIKQIKVKIPAGKLTDKYGNSNVETDLIVYNTLRMEDMEEVDSVGKTSAETETEWNAILTDEFLGESTGTRIYPTNSNPDPIKRQEIEKIEFVNNLNSLLDGEKTKVWDTTEKEWNIKTGIQRVWDVSAQGDKSILAWTTQTQEPYTVYVGSAYEIFGNQESRYLFAGIGSGTSSTATTTIANLDFLNTSSVTNMYAMFYKCGYKSMTSLELGDFDTSNVTNMYGMFSNLGYTAMTTFDIGENFDTSKVTNMEMMFSSCGYTKMTSLDLGDKFNTSNVSSMFAMFRYCGIMSMTTLNLGDKFDTSNVINMTEMFMSCGLYMTNMHFGTETGTTGKIVFPDKFNTSKVTRMFGMFYGFGAVKMTSLDLGNNFDTSNVTEMSRMFFSCGAYEMTTLNLGDKFNTSKVKNMSDMFRGCGNLKMTSLDLGDKFYTTSVTNMSNMFNSCGAGVMTTLDLGPAFTKIAETNTDMFSYCGTTGLKIYAPESIYSNRTTFK